MKPPRLVPLRSLPGEEVRRLVRFCGYCGRGDENHAANRSRVCPQCGLGLFLIADSSLAPQAQEPFFVIDEALRVCALSGKAEKLFGMPEKDALKRHVNEFITPAESIFQERFGLMSLLAGAVRQSPYTSAPTTVAVRLPGEFGVRYSARVGPCEPSPAAVITLAPL